jgi:hypothetical protein
MQIHEITVRKNTQVSEGLGSFISGLTGGLTDKFAKTPGGVKPSWNGGQGGINPADYGAGYKTPSDKWEDKYNALQKDPAVASYVKSVAAGWEKNGLDLIKNTPATTVAPSQKKKAKKPVATTKPTATTGAFGQMANQLSKAATPTTRATTKIPYGKASAPGAVSEPVSLGGKQLNPKNPNDAQVLAAIKKQGKLHEATAAAPNASQVKTAFVSWSDGQLATRVPETGATITMNDVRKLPNLATKLSAALNQVVQSQGTPAQSQAVEAYIKLAVAGVQALAQSSKNGVSTRSAKSGTAPNAGAGNKATPSVAPGKNATPGEEPPAEEPTQTEPAKPTMTKAQISQWISRNSEDPATLKAALDAINAVKV